MIILTTVWLIITVASLLANLILFIVLTRASRVLKMVREMCDTSNDDPMFKRSVSHRIDKFYDGWDGTK
jgi:hypothetical protein